MPTSFLTAEQDKAPFHPVCAALTDPLLSVPSGMLAYRRLVPAASVMRELFGSEPRVVGADLVGILDEPLAGK